MIRLFLTLCKCFQVVKKNDDYLLYQLYCENAVMDKLPCAYPRCPSTGRYSAAGSYSRSLVCYTNGRVERHQVHVPRIECSSCGHTHALLPPVVIPHSPFSLHFVISLLYDFITHAFHDVHSLCSRYDISVSTLYRIWHRFIEDKKLMLGLMDDLIISTQAFLKSFIDFSMADDDRRLMAYFKRLGISFLQPGCTLRQMQLHRLSEPHSPA